MPSQETEIMVAPEVCGDAEFPLINFTIKKILDLGFHLKLAVTNKLVILERNHSLHCWKTNDTKIRTTGVSSKQSFKDYKLIYSWQFKKEWQIYKKHVSSWNNSKKRSQFQRKWILLPFTSTFRSKTQIQKLSTSALLWTPNFFHPQNAPTFLPQRYVLQE